jgi:peptide/nickel transport system permease protein
MNLFNIHQKIKFARLNKPAKVYLMVCLVLGLLAPIIANHLPLAVSLKGEWFFPAFDNNGNAVTSEGTIHFASTDWNSLTDATLIFAPIPYSPGQSDFTDPGYSPPLTRSKDHKKGMHWLGTGKRGEDVLAGILHGIRISLSVAIFSMLIAGFLGITIGAAAGYLGDNLKVNKFGFWMAIFGALPAWFYSGKLTNLFLDGEMLLTRYFLFLLFFVLILAMLKMAGERIVRSVKSFQQLTVPIDTFLMKIVELVSSIPVLLLILSIAAITRPSISNLVWIIGITSWTEVARLTRAEVLKLREMDFISSAKATGMPVFRIVKNHLIPNALTPVYVALAYGAGGAILAESGLSFLGVGVPPEAVTWGKIIAEGRQNFDAWWLVVFPGIMISATVMAFYSLRKK